VTMGPALVTMGQAMNSEATCAHCGNVFKTLRRSARFCLQRLMDDDLSFERAYEQMMKARPTPNATIEAVKQAVRDRGVSALDEKQTRERLQRCDAVAIAEIDHWLLKRGIS
jgi:hypothetical protein